MGPFTVVPVWIIQDVIVLVLGVLTALFIVQHEEHPAPILLEFVCFIFLNAAVYENFATLMAWYGYGRSILMIFNVPLTVPILEYLVVYAALRLLDTMDIRTWCKPFVVGALGMLADLSLDPLAVRQVYQTQAGSIGRWTWLYPLGAVNIFDVPVYNFSGWVLLCGYAAAALLLGRWWYRKSGWRSSVGYIYPVLSMLLALGILVTPLSQFLLWLGPLMAKGGVAEWIMMGTHLVVATVLLAVCWHGRMLRRLSFREDMPVFVVFITSHVSNIVFALIGGFYEILWLQILAAAVEIGLILFIAARGRALSSDLVQVTGSS